MVESLHFCSKQCQHSQRKQSEADRHIIVRLENLVMVSYKLCKEKNNMNGEASSKQGTQLKMWLHFPGAERKLMSIQESVFYCEHSNMKQNS